MRRHENAITITAAHRERLAVFYLCQPDGSTLREADRAQRQHAARWGWAPAKIVEAVDVATGPTALEDRKAYDNLLRQIAAGAVGLVLVRDLRYLGNCWREVMAFLEFSQAANTLVAADGVLVDDPDCVWWKVLKMWAFLEHCSGT